MTESIANFAVVLATISTVAFLLPQIFKLNRTGDSAGVSTTWAVLGFVSNVGWFAYMISQERWFAVAAPLSTFIFYAVVVVSVSKTGRLVNGPVRFGLAWAALLAVTGTIAGWIVLGVVLAFTYAVQVTPSIWTAYRTHDPSGIAPVTWMIGAVEAVLWGTYGLFFVDPGIILFGVVQLLASVLILARYHATRNPALEPV